MLESQIRAHSARLQKMYDKMPHPVQTMLTSARGWFLVRNRYRDDMHSYLRELRSHEQWSTEQMEAFQVEALQQIVDHARNTVPAYSEYPGLKFESTKDLAKYPVLTRETVRSQPDRFISTAGSATERIRVGTTGTTGASLRVAYSEIEARNNWAFHMRRWAWAGVEPRSPRVTFFGSRVVPPERSDPPFWTHNYLERQSLASIFHMSEGTAPHYVKFLLRNRGKTLEGFPSVLAILANFVLNQGKPIPMRVVFTDGEPLYPFLRETIELAFQTKVFDLYGNTEASGLIHECEHHRMHAAPDYAYLEILDDKDQPVQKGEEGYLVWTGFVNATMPLIRYRIGDRGCWVAGDPCPCGRAFPVVVPTITRESDLLHCPDGRIFSPRALNQSLKSAQSLRFCQLIQEQLGHVVVRGVASTADAYADLMSIRKNLQKVLGSQIVVSATLADSPIVRAGGKIPLIVQAIQQAKEPESPMIGERAVLQTSN
ncbi:MAG TPA: hypothetical protein VGI16_14965 [Candidatus Acidoferrum sp.]|jgi:phenylacetate-CoA ligase